MQRLKRKKFMTPLRTRSLMHVITLGHYLSQVTLARVMTSLGLVIFLVIVLFFSTVSLRF